MRVAACKWSETFFFYKADQIETRGMMINAAFSLNFDLHNCRNRRYHPIGTTLRVVLRSLCLVWTYVFFAN